MNWCWDRRQVLTRWNNLDSPTVGACLPEYSRTRCLLCDCTKMDDRHLLTYLHFENRRAAEICTRCVNLLRELP